MIKLLKASVLHRSSNDKPGSPLAPAQLGFKQSATLFFGCAFLAATAFGEIQLGNKGAVAFGFDGMVEYDSNIRKNSDEEEDLLFIGLPKVLYRFNEGALYIDAFAGVQLRKYTDNSQFDSENLKSGIQMYYPHDENDQNFELDLSAGFEESTTADEDLQAIVEKEKTSLSFGGKYFFTDRYYVKSEVRYRSEDVQESGFNDVDSFTIPVSVFYRYSDALSLGAGVQYRETSVDGTTPPADSSDQAFYLALEGMITPTVEGDVRVGYQYRDFDASEFEDEGAVFAEVGLTWRANERSAVDLILGNEFETSAANQSVEKLYAELALRHEFDAKISGSAALGYADKDFSSLAGDNFRNDEVWTATLEGEYELIEDRLSLNALLRYVDQQSDRSESDYSQTVALIGITLIY